MIFMGIPKSQYLNIFSKAFIALYQLLVCSIFLDCWLWLQIMTVIKHGAHMIALLNDPPFLLSSVQLLHSCTGCLGCRREPNADLGPYCSTSSLPHMAWPVLPRPPPYSWSFAPKSLLPTHQSLYRPWACFQVPLRLYKPWSCSPICCVPYLSPHFLSPVSCFVM